jgi:hypothetical protein
MQILEINGDSGTCALIEILKQHEPRTVTDEGMQIVEIDGQA